MLAPLVPPHRKPYSCGQCAALLGISKGTFTRRRFHLMARCGMPAPIPGDGHPKWDRASFDAWRNRTTPPAAAANDAAPTAAPEITAWQQALDQEYASA